MSYDSRPSLMYGARKHKLAPVQRTPATRLDVDVVRFLTDLNAIQAHAEKQRPTEGDDQRDWVARAGLVLSEYVMHHGGSA